MGGEVHFFDTALAADFEWTIWDVRCCDRCQFVPEGDPSPTTENELTAALVAFDGWNRAEMALLLLCDSCVDELEEIAVEPPFEYPSDGNLDYIEDAA